MNWEHSVLNRIYKTQDFKVNTTTINRTTAHYMNKVNELIHKYKLNEFNLNLSQSGAIYKMKENKNTFYFSYETNMNFILATNFFEVENKFINYEDLNYEGIEIENNDEERSYQHFNIDGLKYANSLKNYLLRLMFNKECNFIEYKNELQRINKYLSFRTFIIGHQVTHYDIILLSIIQNWKNKKEREEYFEQENLINLSRWGNYLDINLELDYAKIERVKDTKAKENLCLTYKLTSNQELIKALQEKDIEKMIELLEKGENVNSRELETYKTLSHLVCRKGDLEILKILISYGCDLEALDDEYMTPIYEAVYSKNLELCEFLIEVMRVNLNHLEIQQRTPFYWAACTGDLEMVNYLLSKGVDINKSSKMGRSPLSKACWNGNIDIVKRLCQEESLIVNLPDKNGRYPLHNAVWGEYGGRLGKLVNGVPANDTPEAALELINKGHEIDVADNEGFTPLMIAASTNGIRSLKILIEKSADPNHLNKYGASAVIEATRYGNAEPVKVLLENCDFVDIDIRDLYGFNAIEYAICFDREESLCLLLKYKQNKHLITEDEYLHLLKLSIQSDSKKCFEIILNELNLREIFEQMNYSHYVNFFKIIIEVVINLYNFHIFNILCKNYSNIINLIFFQDIQLLVKALILVDNNVKLNLDKLNSKTKSNKNIDTYQINKNNDENFVGNNSVENNSDSDSDLNTKEETLNEYNSNVENLFNIYLTKLSENKKVSENIIKLFILLNDTEKFNKIIQIIIHNNLEINQDEIIIKKENYSYITVDKKRKVENNSYLEEWLKILNDLIYHNILTISIEKSENIFFNKIINLDISQDFIFVNLIDKKNILHIIFQFDIIEKFNRILNIVETHHPNKVIKILQMLDEQDLNSLTPLDVLMKNKLFDLVEKYTKILNDLRVKHNIIDHHKNHQTFYQILDYEIIDENKIDVNEYKIYIEENYKMTTNLMKKLSKNEDNFNSNLNEEIKFVNYKNVINTIENLNQKVSEIIENINSGKIDFEFKIKNKNYLSHWVDDEISLKNCKEHLEKYNFIGVDLEYHGSNSEKDGVVCVLQLSSLDQTFAIDTLKLRNKISLYLKQIFENENIIKVFHGCDNDIVWLITNFGIFTKNIFDTGRAYLVFQKYILNKSFKVSNLPSLNYLTKFFLQMEIDKSYQKSDWRIRPLTASKIFNLKIILDMLQYALNDAKSVIYLFLIFIGLFQFLNKIKLNSEFYEKILIKFNENRENVILNPNFQMNMILIETCMRCNELIKLKIKDNYFKLMIKLNNN